MLVVHFHVELIYLVPNCRIAELEKDLYYYKMTSREFKKKLRTVSREGELDVGAEHVAVSSRPVTAAGDSALPLPGLSIHKIMTQLF